MAALVYSEGQGKMTLKAGDEVYACKCGAISQTPGKCPCGKDMVEVR